MVSDPLLTPAATPNPPVLVPVKVSDLMVRGESSVLPATFVLEAFDALKMTSVL